MFDIGIIPYIIWRFPKMGVPPVIIHFERWDSFHDRNPSILGYPHLWKAPQMDFTKKRGALKQTRLGFQRENSPPMS